ncbi:MAG: hypothetical protein K2G02_09275 [Phocaeicola sp.]|uniref:hypothetical protein n=1 Tax=Phocaeicola sp. TaxID=2773926 RepID=UPI0023D56C3B|nr:hypothetical protein [Phocaeicola sp.]MDE5677827.1 hypothetical protein [Phocaeicola sp.]MDE6181279.1 hypothetical protein [Phocaeicola sp.]
MEYISYTFFCRKGSWLPEAESAEESQEITAFLKSLQGSFRPILVSYDGSVVCEKVIFQQGKATLHASEWSCYLKPEKSNWDVLDLEVCFNVDKGELQSGGVAVAFDFKDWSRDNFVLIPAYVYNGNRFNAFGCEGAFHTLLSSSFHRHTKAAWCETAKGRCERTHAGG